MTQSRSRAVEPVVGASEEYVVLVDDDNRVLGTRPKALVHGANTPLHRAFSSYLFRAGDKKLLLQQRSHKKHTWPLVWSNSCCGHPRLDESNEAAARRRIDFELGLVPIRLEEVAPYRYCFVRDGVMENEICPILVGLVDAEPRLNSDEVEATGWIDWHAFLAEITSGQSGYSDWCVEQTQLLAQTPRFRAIVGL